MHSREHISRETTSFALEFESVSHTYTMRKQPEVTALDGVTFSVKAGTITAIVGPNGSGKTTVFKLLTGLLPLNNGRIAVNGYDVSERAKIQREVGVVFQSPSLDSQLTVRENIVHYGLLYGMRFGKELDEHEIISLLNIETLLDTKVETLSGGYQRRVELAKVLLTDPKTIVLDEPFSGLDADAREKFFAVLQLLSHNRGLSVVVITHLLQIAARCDDVVVLDSGKVLAHNAPSTLTAALGESVVDIHSLALDSILAHMSDIGDLNLQRISGTVALLTGIRLDSVLNALNGSSATVQQIESRKPSLEDYFQSKTGKRYIARKAGEGAA